MLQAEVDGTNEYNDFQRASLNTTKQLIKDLKKTDAVFHIGDICYANGYLSQWDQFTAQIEPIASTVPYMIARFCYFHYFLIDFLVGLRFRLFRFGYFQFRFIQFGHNPTEVN